MIMKPVQLPLILLTRTIQSTTLQLTLSLNEKGVCQYILSLDGKTDGEPERNLHTAIMNFQHLDNILRQTCMFQKL